MTRVLTGLLIAALAACATQPTVPARVLPLAARAQPGHYVVVTVRNPRGSAPTPAASTPRGYDDIGTYQAGSAALRVSQSIAADYGLREVASWPIALLNVHCLVYDLPSGGDPERLLASLRRDRRVESAQPLQSFATEGEIYNDPYAGLQRNLDPLRIAQAQQLSRGRGVRVALIDTGGDESHPDLRPHSLRVRNFVDSDQRLAQGDVHGLAVTGVIAAVPNNRLGIVGIAPEADVSLYKACWRSQDGGGRSVCNSFTLALALAAAIEARADIVNLSLGGPSDPLLARLVLRGVESGVIFVGAVPRSGLRAGFPTEIPQVLAVDVAEAARHTPGVIVAPGQDILSLAPAGRYDYYSGSSLATAEISGLIALLKSQRPKLSAAEARELLIGSPAGAMPDVYWALGAASRAAACISSRCGLAASYSATDSLRQPLRTPQ